MSYERNWSIYSFVHNKVCNRLQPSRAEGLVYIYTNNGLPRHRRGPKSIQWYGIHQIHSDDESDGKGSDGDDPGGYSDIDANMTDNDNIGSDDYGFDNIESSNNASNGDDSNSRDGGESREYNGGGYEFDGSSGGGGDDFGVFDFHKGDHQPHATMSIPPADDEPKDVPPIKIFSVAEGLREVPHGDSMVVVNPTTDKVEPSQPVSDSLDFGDVGEGSNIH